MGTGVRGLAHLLLLLAWTYPTSAIMGYDCGSNNLYVTTLSLLEVGECNFHKTGLETKETYVQLFQLSNLFRTKIMQCKVEVKRTMYYCGMYSHISAVNNGEMTFLKEISRSQCQKMHEFGIIILNDDLYIKDLKMNFTNYRAVTFAGTTDLYGKSRKE